MADFRNSNDFPMRTAFLISISVLLTLIFGCTTARQRSEEQNLYHVLKFKSSETEQFLDRQYRSGNIYLDYGTVLIVDAIYKDLSYRKRYYEEFSEVYYLEDTAKKELWKKNIEEYQNYYEFLVFIYSGGNDNVDFGNSKSQWQAFLKDDDGDILRPGEIHKLRRDVKEMVYLDKYFYPLDRWTEAYRIRFPRYNAKQVKKDFPFQLVFSGIQGKTVMSWEDSSLFYQWPEEYK